MRVHLLLSKLALLAALCGACTGTSEETSSIQQSSEFGRSACTSCLAKTCSDELTACGHDPACAEYWLCVQGCPVGPNGDAEQACEADCTRSRPLLSSQAKAAGAALYRCRNQDAGTDCAACGKVASKRGSHDPLLNQQCAASTETNACYRCEAERCCHSYDQYKRNPEAVSLVGCVQGCLDKKVSASCIGSCLKLPDQDQDSCEALCDILASQCQADCRKSHPAGVQDFSTRLLCTTARCGQACNNGAPLDPCVACTLDHCMDTLIACNTDPDCNLSKLCSETCLATGQGYPSGCPQRCLKMAPPAAQQLLLADQLCGIHSCPAECGTPLL